MLDQRGGSLRDRPWCLQLGKKLPRGGSLPEEVWSARHRMLVRILQLHLPVLLVLGLVTRVSPSHLALEIGGLGGFALLASLGSAHRRLASAVTALGLVVASSLLVHLGDGVIELHFHFFVVVVLLALYQDWLPFLSATAFVFAQHAVLGAISPELVFNHPSAAEHPLLWAAVHVVFLGAAAAGSVLAWRLNEELAVEDPLTHLPNRARFRACLEHAVARAGRGARPAVVFIDLDGFKVVNDSLGHASGDELLTAVADRLAAALAPGELLARLGGDEFAVLLADASGEAEVLAVGERLLAALEPPFTTVGGGCRIGASIGIACRSGAETADDLLRSADLAMYEAKRLGRSRVAAFRPAMRAAIEARAATEQALRRAMEGEQLSLRYQPVVDLRTGAMLGVEALLRWEHPTEGTLRPDRFLHAAEESGLILPIGEWVLRTACADGARWHAECPDQPLSVAVNVSATQLRSPSFPSAVRAALAASGLPASSLVLEITESVAVDGLDRTVLQLQALRRLGLRIAIDDFGTGYSSLSYLRQLPFDMLKVDRAFVQDVVEDHRSLAVTRAIIDLARALGMTTIAEGVETLSQRDYLAALGCDGAQGYVFAAPLHADDVARRLSARSAIAATV